MPVFLSASPQISLTNLFSEPYNNAVATARTCYSAELVGVSAVSGKGLSTEQSLQKQLQRDRIAASTYEAGHHTILQHAHAQFALSGVSRHFLWSFLHAFPYYNSEQQSQRYVHVRPGKVIEPDLGHSELQAVYQECIEDQTAVYETLTQSLFETAAEEYFRIFPGRRKDRAKYEKDIRKRTQEVARYVLPIGTFATLYHTVSLVTLLRYHHMANQMDVPEETRLIIAEMVRQVCDADPQVQKLLESPLLFEDMPESPFLQRAGKASQEFLDEFDSSLAGKVSKLVDWKQAAQESMAAAVREVLGLATSELTDREALELVLNPAQNRILSTTLNTTVHSKLTRVLHHPHYTFRKKLSHAADSQDQRHRMVPGSRPVLGLHLNSQPDYITPRLLKADAPSLALYEAAMERIWQRVNQLISAGVSVEKASYLLPNAVSIRFTESGDLLNLHHKLKARLCYNAQEEIWQASLDELEQISAIHPEIGKYLRPPCGLRQMGGRTPFCPEGQRFCGVPVWKKEPAEYARLL